MEPATNRQAGEPEIALLTRALKAGSEEAFREFHARYFERLYRFLLVVARGQEQEAQDALQQTFVRVVKHVRVFESEDVFWSWLKVVARSAARDGGRKEQRYSALLGHFAMRLKLERPEPTPSEEDGLQGALQESMAELPADERALLEAKYLQGLTVKEISLSEQVTEKTIESRLGRARRILRDNLLKKLSCP